MINSMKNMGVENQSPVFSNITTISTRNSDTANASTSNYASSNHTSSLWSLKEDNLLMELISKYGTSRWSLIASYIPSKTNKQCRRRWQNLVKSPISKGPWSLEEDAQLLRGHHLYGNKWTEIAKLLPGRTDNATKNRFRILKKRSSKLLSAFESANGGSSSSQEILNDQNMHLNPSVNHSDTSKEETSKESDEGEQQSHLNASAPPSPSRSSSPATKSSRLWLDLNMPLTYA